MTILNIRGTSGAGKTHLVRRLMAAAGPGDKVMVRHPLKEREIIGGYSHPQSNLFFIGSYEANCGGCDKFSWKGADDWIGELIVYHARGGAHVIYEGLITSNWRADRVKQLSLVAPAEVVFLTTTLEDCLKAVSSRREARGVTEPMDPYNTEKTFNDMTRKAIADKKAGLAVHMLDREAAFQHCCRELGLSPEAA